MASVTYCKNCGIAIQWGKTEAGKAMPIDLGAAADGNVIFLDAVRVHVLKKDEETDKPRFHSHMETCPSSPYASKKRETAKPPREALAKAMGTERASQGTLL
jgi:hypothetical protein